MEQKTGIRAPARRREVSYTAWLQGYIDILRHKFLLAWVTRIPQRAEFAALDRRSQSEGVTPQHVDVLLGEWRETRNIFISDTSLLTAPMLIRTLPSQTIFLTD